jgi:hypothetical protein
MTLDLAKSATVADTFLAKRFEGNNSRSDLVAGM